jgi:hypothetical protein
MPEISFGPGRCVGCHLETDRYSPDTPMNRTHSVRLAAARLAAILVLVPTYASAAGAQVLRGHVPREIAESTALGPMERSARLNLAIGLPLRNADELERLLGELVDPESENYRRYLSSEQFTERFGPSVEDYRKLAEFLNARGLSVTSVHPNRMILDVNGSVEAVEQTLHVNMVRWQHAARGAYFAPDRDPSIDTGVQILSIGGLDNFTLPRPMGLNTRPFASGATPMTTGSGPSGLFIGNDFRTAYAPGVTLTGAGQAVGLFELDGFFAADVTSNFQYAGLPPAPVQTVLLDGFSGTPGGDNVEVILDIMMAAYMAPGAKIIVYEGTTWNDVLNRMATDNLAKQLSSSWCFYPTDATTEQIFKQMIAQGQSLFQASGDSGSYNGWIMPPADDPNVTVVGGTSLTTSVAGGPWKSETTWGGSGGGVSTTWPIPSYQQTMNMAAAGGSATMRNIPDVALTADVQMFLVCNNGQAVMVGGTSAAAPLWAGFTALANQQSASHGKPTVGFLNPALYKIGAGSSAAADLHDITTGSNGAYQGKAGYDLATGWGTPAGQGLINDLTGVLPSPSFGITLSNSPLKIAAGASGPSTVTINPLNGFGGTVNLTISGLPSGVTASFNPAAAAASSTLTVTASSGAAPGSATATITGTSGSLTATAQLTLTVTAPPSYTLSATPAAVTVAQGSTGTSSIQVTPQGGFTGSVALTASGLPAGVTAVFSPASTTGSSTLTFTAAASAAIGAATVTITGTSGSLHPATTIALTVSAPPPSFTIAASPASISVPTGASGTSAITLAPQNGFNAAVTFAASGFPLGVTATFGALTASHTSTATFAVGASVAAGVYSGTVTATSGSISSRAAVSLTVTPAPGFSLSAAPAAVSFTVGAAGGTTITVTPLIGFAGTVTLAVSGVPTGVTASLGSSSTKTASTLTFTSTSAAAAAASTITVTGTSGSLTAQTTLTLTLTPPPAFSLTATPASLPVGPGASGTTSIAVVPRNGFNGTVTFNVSGLPSGATASFSPASSATGTVLTITVPKTAANSTSTVTIAGTSGSLTASTSVTLTIAPQPGFTLTATPSALSVPIGASGGSALTLTSLNGFTGAVTLTVSGLPAGVAGTFSAGSNAASVVFTLWAGAGAVPGTSTVTITGKSGALAQTAATALTVSPGTAGNTMVNLSSLYNVSGIVMDNMAFTSGGLDGGGRAYSANLLAPIQSLGGTPFSLGPPNAPGALSGGTVPLPAGKYASIQVLATSVNGNQTAQTFTVNYSDGTTSAFTQSLSDWCTPQSYTGESKAVSMTYRDNSDGTRDTRPLQLSGYSFSPAAGKTVSSISLPQNRNVVVLAISLTASAASTAPAQVSLTTAFDTIGIVTDGKTFTGGVDGVGYAYSLALLGATETIGGAVFNLGPANAADIVTANGKTITLTAGQFSKLQMLATGVNGAQAAQAFKVNYSDGTSSTFTQGLSDWFTPSSYSGEVSALTMPYRDTSAGARDSRPFHVYEYTFALNNAKTVSSVVLPLNANVKILAMTLAP